MSRNRRAFRPEFKAEAVRQVTEGRRSVAQVAAECSIRPEQLRTWQQELLADGTVARPLRVESAEDELRRVVGWATSAHLDRPLVQTALDRALAIRQPCAGLLHHSDRGSQDASGNYQASSTGLTGGNRRRLDGADVCGAAAVTRIGVDAGECCAAVPLASR